MPGKGLNVRKGDEVMVITGKDRSLKGKPKRGRVLEVNPVNNRIVVDGLNIMKRAVRQTQQMRQAGIVESPGPIHISNVMLLCPSCDAPTRVGHRRRDDGTKVRVCKKCGKDIDD
jgi:large subunit ribosomal protein L24